MVFGMVHLQIVITLFLASFGSLSLSSQEGLIKKKGIFLAKIFDSRLDKNLSFGFTLLNPDSVIISYSYLASDDQTFGFDLFKCPYKDGKIYILGIDTLKMDFTDDKKDIQSKVFGKLEFFILHELKEITFKPCCNKILKLCRNKNFYSFGSNRVFIDRKKKKGKFFIGKEIKILELDFFYKYSALRNLQFRSPIVGFLTRNHYIAQLKFNGVSLFYKRPGRDTFCYFHRPPMGGCVYPVNLC